MCNGYAFGKTIAAITHFHADHTAGINIMLKKCDIILVHPITHAALAVLEPGINLRKQFVTTNYDTPFRGSDYVIRLLRSNHIPGSCQVLVEHKEKRLLYSGDFNYPDVHIPKCDYLVLDATHGDPSYDYEQVDRKKIMQKMSGAIVDKTNSGESVQVRSSRGMLQEIMWGLSASEVLEDVLFVADRLEIDILRAMYAEDFMHNRVKKNFLKDLDHP